MSRKRRAAAATAAAASTATPKSRASNSSASAPISRSKKTKTNHHHELPTPGMHTEPASSMARFAVHPTTRDSLHEGSTQPPRIEHPRIEHCDDNPPFATTTSPEPSEPCKPSEPSLIIVERAMCDDDITSLPAAEPAAAQNGADTGDTKLEQLPKQHPEPEQPQEQPDAKHTNLTHELNLSTDSAIIVFQCGQCRSILSDSSLEYEFSDACDILFINAATNVIIDDKFSMSQSGFDAGCSFHMVTCQQCRTVLGKIYTSTVPELDHRRNIFMFETDHLLTYRIGECTTPAGRQVQCAKKEAPTPSKPELSTSKTLATVSTEMHTPLESFEELDSHVNELTEAVNTMTDVVKENRTTIAHLQSGMETACSKVADGETTLANVQNLVVLWDQRVHKIDALEQDFARMASAMQSLEKHAQICQQQRSQVRFPVPRIMDAKRSTTPSTRTPRSKPSSSAPSSTKKR